MTELPASTLVTRLLTLPDAHGALLADFDFYPEHDLLYVRWHGHLTADAMVRGAQAGMALFGGRRLPHRLLSNHQQVTGEWADALPWLQYAWLPEANAHGLELLAHVLAPNTAHQLLNYHGGPEFVAAFTSELHALSFRHIEPAWHWVTNR